MEGDANQMSQATLCRSGCGFYGNPAQDGLCSKCFKDALKRKQSTPASAQSSAVSASSRGGGGSSPLGPSPISTESSSPPPPPPPSPPLLLSSNTDMLASLTTASPTVPIVICSNAGSSSSSSPGELSEKCNLDAGLEGAHAAIESMDTDASQDANDVAQRDKKKKNRCQTCRKKVGLTGFECRCGGLFCSLHRYSDKHDCSFDYKGLGAQEIRKNNPIVVGEKIQKI